MYLQYLLKENKGSPLFKFQAENPITDDWFEQVKYDIDVIKINNSLDDIKQMKNEK